MFACSLSALGFVQTIEPPVELIGTVNKEAMVAAARIGKLSSRGDVIFVVSGEVWISGEV
jgi:hypothetical protein